LQKNALVFALCIVFINILFINILIIGYNFNRWEKGICYIEESNKVEITKKLKIPLAKIILQWYYENPPIDLQNRR